MDRHISGCFQTLVNKVAGDHLSGPEGFAGGHGGEADGAAAADQNGFPCHLGGFHTVYAGPHRLKHTGGLVGQILVQREGTVPADAGIFRESAGNGHAEQLHVFADVLHAVVAEPAVVAGNVGFAGDPIPHLPPGHVFAHGYNVACGLMADDQRRFGVDLTPLVPFHDVHIRTADGGTVYFDQHLVIAGLRDGEICPVDELSGSGRFFYQTPHGF